MDLSFTYMTCGILVLIVLLLMFLYYRDAKKKIEGFPFVVPKLSFPQATRKIPKGVSFTNYGFNIIIKSCKKHAKEGLFMVHIFRPVLVIFKEETIKFFSNEKAAIDKSPEYDIIEQFLGDGLITSNGERWRTHRRMINPAFHIGKLKDKVSLFNEHALVLVQDMEKLVEKESVDLVDVLKNHYFNVLYESVFGIKADKRNKAEISRLFYLIDSAGDLAVQRILSLVLRPKFLLNLTPFGRKYLKEKKEYDNIITKVINDMIDHINSSKTEDPDQFSTHLQKSFTYILLSEHAKNPAFTLQDVRDHVSTILAAGYDTTAYTTQWCLFLLGLHPEVQEKVFNEVQSTKDSYITYEESCDFTYLEAVIMETLRLYPTAPIYARNISEDVQYGKYKVHKGTSVIFVSYMSHRDPDVFPDPENFEPDRFLNAELKKTWSFVPFSEGSRSCIGKRYALIQLRIFLAYIVRNFKIISLDKREDISLKWTIVLAPARPIRMQITPRSIEE